MIQGATDKRLDKQLPKIQRRLQEFIGKLWLVGSDDVVEAILAWRRFSQEQSPDASSAGGLVALADILLAMRRDLGNTTTGMTARDILATFINDIDKHVDENGRARPIVSD